jgi:hypothetical protein
MLDLTKENGSVIYSEIRSEHRPKLDNLDVTSLSKCKIDYSLFLMYRYKGKVGETVTTLRHAKFMENTRSSALDLASLSPRPEQRESCTLPRHESTLAGFTVEGFRHGVFES